MTCSHCRNDSPWTLATELLKQAASFETHIPRTSPKNAGTAVSLRPPTRSSVRWWPGGTDLGIQHGLKETYIQWQETYGNPPRKPSINTPREVIQGWFPPSEFTKENLSTAVSKRCPYFLWAILPAVYAPTGSKPRNTWKKKNCPKLCQNYGRLLVWLITGCKWDCTVYKWGDMYSISGFTETPASFFLNLSFFTERTTRFSFSPGRARA